MSISAHDPDELVTVLVPRRLLPGVYRILADGMVSPLSVPPSPGPTPQSSGSPSGAQPSGNPWTAEAIARLKEAIRTPTPRVILDLTTKDVGSRVSLRDIEKAAGRTYPQARADLAGFTQLVRRRFNREHWPFKVEWAPGGFANYYVDDPDIARWWRGK